MSTEDNLKKQNTPYFWTFFTFYAVIFVLSLFAIYFETILDDYKAILTLRSAGILIAPLILFILNGLLSSNQKAVLVFWRFKHPLPGSRAFTVLGFQDSRVNMTQKSLLLGICKSWQWLVKIFNLHLLASDL